MTNEKLFTKGEAVIHKNLGEVVFVGYDLFDGECIVVFTDELGYDDEVRVSTGMLSKLIK